jgi:hypothetical protein
MLEAKILIAQDDKADKNPTLKLLTTTLIKIEVQPARVIHLLRDQQGKVTEKGDTYALCIRCEGALPGNNQILHNSLRI